MALLACILLFLGILIPVCGYALIWYESEVKGIKNNSGAIGVVIFSLGAGAILLLSAGVLGLILLFT